MHYRYVDYIMNVFQHTKEALLNHCHCYFMWENRFNVFDFELGLFASKMDFAAYSVCMVNDLMRWIHTTISVSVDAKGLLSLYCHHYRCTERLSISWFISLHRLNFSFFFSFPKWNYKNAPFKWNQIGKQFSNYHMKNVRSSHCRFRISRTKMVV